MIYDNEEVKKITDEIEKDFLDNGIILENFRQEGPYNGFIQARCVVKIGNEFNVKLVILLKRNELNNIEAIYKVNFYFEFRFYELENFIAPFNDIGARFSCDDPFCGLECIESENHVNSVKEFCELVEKYKKFIANIKTAFNVK